MTELIQTGISQVPRSHLADAENLGPLLHAERCHNNINVCLISNHIGIPFFVYSAFVFFFQCNEVGMTSLSCLHRRPFYF